MPRETLRHPAPRCTYAIRDLASVQYASQQSCDHHENQKKDRHLKAEVPQPHAAERAMQRAPPTAPRVTPQMKELRPRQRYERQRAPSADYQGAPSPVSRNVPRPPFLRRGHQRGAPRVVDPCQCGTCSCRRGWLLRQPLRREKPMRYRATRATRWLTRHDDLSPALDFPQKQADRLSGGRQTPEFPSGWILWRSRREG